MACNEIKNNLQDHLARYRPSLNTPGTISKSRKRCVTKNLSYDHAHVFCSKQFTFKRLSLQSPPISVVRHIVPLICNCNFLHSNESKVVFPWQLRHLHFQLKK